jgi:hypothetical protein
MQLLLQTIKKHPLALLAYIAYMWLLISQVRLSLHFTDASKLINRGDKIAWGEGVMYGWLLLFMVGLGTGIVMLFNAILYKDNRLFYLYSGLGFIIPMIVVTYLYVCKRISGRLRHPVIPYIKQQKAFLNMRLKVVVVVVGCCLQ